MQLFGCKVKTWIRTLTQNYFRPKDWYKRVRDNLHRCTQYSMHNMSSYIAVFHCAASRAVGITDDELLDRFVTGLKPKIYK